MLGWQHKEKGIPPEQLSLKGLLPSTQRDAVSELMEYQHWREQYRGSSPRSAVFPIRACIALARFLYHDTSKVSCCHSDCHTITPSVGCGRGGCGSAHTSCS